MEDDTDAFFLEREGGWLYCSVQFSVAGGRI